MLDFMKRKKKMTQEQQENTELKDKAPEAEVKEEAKAENSDKAAEAKPQEPVSSEKEEKPASEAKEEEKPVTEADKIKALEKELGDVKKRYLTALADYQNLSKRAANDQAAARSRGVAEFLKKLLPVMDTLDKAMEQCQKVELDKKVMDGLEMFSIQFSDMLEKEGLKEIQALGNKFDPNCQEAMMNQNNPDKEDEEVLMVFEKGYMFKDQVLRCAKVVVNKK